MGEHEANNQPNNTQNSSKTSILLNHNILALLKYIQTIEHSTIVH